MRFLRILKTSAIHGRSIDIYVPIRNTYFSLTNSPYPPHVMGIAVDIYTEYPYMPVELGVVRDVIRVETPRYRADSQGYDYIILIDLGYAVLKVMHVRPHVSIGDKLYLGDYIGEYLISGYLRPWSTPHMHLEVRPSEDPLRVRGGYFLEPTTELVRYLSRLPCSRTLRFKVIDSTNSYVWVVPIDEGYICTNVGILDAGYPYYGYGGAIVVSNGKYEDKVVWNGMELGSIVSIVRNRVLYS